MAGDPGGLPRHPLSCWRVAGNAVDGPGEVERLLNRPDLLMLIWRVDPGRVTHSDPANRYRRARRQDRVDLNDAVDPHFAPCSHHPARQEAPPPAHDAPVPHPPPPAHPTRSP